MVLSRIVRHERGGTSGLPLRGRLDVRDTDLPTRPAARDGTFRAPPPRAAAMRTGAGSPSTGAAQRPWVVVAGADAHREVLTPAPTAGVTVVARPRRDAQRFAPPPVLKPGPKRGPGRPPTSGKNRLSLAQRAGPRRGGPTIDVVTTTGQVVLVPESDGSWRAFLGTAPAARVEAIVPATRDRWALAQHVPDVKAVEGLEQVPWRRVWSHVGAWNRSPWVRSLVEWWGGSRPVAEWSARSARRWEDAERRPAHADRRQALRRAMLEEEFPWSGDRAPPPRKIRCLLDRVVKRVA